MNSEEHLKAVETAIARVERMSPTTATRYALDLLNKERTHLLFQMTAQRLVQGEQST